MYNRFFGFRERPFKLVPNPAYLYLSRIHEEVLAHLNYAVNYGEGFVAITGDIGTGKTTLCRMFLENLDDATEAAYIFNPKLDARQLLTAINDEFGIPSDTDSVKALIDRLNTFLLEQKAQGRRVILLVDEAQNLSPDVLEQLRLLSNLETTTSKLLQIILVGQPELGEMLASDALRQLNQRITLSCHLMPLTATETREYIRHRLHVASQKPGVTFSAAACRAIYSYTGGVPRLINIASDRALLTAFTLGRMRISARIVRRAIRELNARRSRFRPAAMRYRRQIIGLVCLLGVVAGGLAVERAVWKPTGGASPPATANDRIDRPSDASTAATTEKTRPGAVEAAVGPVPDPAPPPPASLPSPPAVAETGLPTPDTVVATTDLAQMIAAMDSDLSRLGALTAVLNRWGLADPLIDGQLAAAAKETLFDIAARRSGLESLRVKGAFNVVKKLNLPAILEFSSADQRDTRFMAIVGIRGDTITLAAATVTVATLPSSLEGLWNGVAHILWKNHYNCQGVIPITASGEEIRALKRYLRNQGFPISALSPVYDKITRSAIETIQARNGLPVDGVVGPQTKIVLYNEDRSLTIPRLETATDG